MTTAERIVLALLGALTVAAFLVLYAPVIVSTLFSFVEYKRDGVDWSTATFDWYRALASNDSVVAALVNTAVVAVGAVGLALILACAIAVYVQRDDAVLSGVIEFVIFLPFLLPPIITGLSLLVFFDDLGVKRDIVTITIGHTTFVLAIVYRTILVRLQGMSRSLFEASGDLGATPWQTFRYVTFPQLRSALLAAAVLALALSFDETLITIFLCGDVATLPIRLWAMMRVGFTPEINALVTIVLATSICLAVAVSLLMKPRGQSFE